MIICVCHGLSEKFVQQLVEAGATSVEDLAARCRAGTDCGNCRDALRRIVEGRARPKPPDSDRAP